MNKIRSENVNICGKLPEKIIEEILDYPPRIGGQIYARETEVMKRT